MSESRKPEPEEPQATDSVAEEDDTGADEDDAGSEAAVSDETAERLQELEAALEQLQSDLKNAQNDYLRAVADFQNYRRRMLVEQEDARQQAIADTIREILPVFDNLQRTIEASEQGASLESLLDGVRLVSRQFDSVLERLGVQQIEGGGQQINPLEHEVIATEESEAPEGTILAIVEKGYRIGERIIRPAKARVSKGKNE